MGRMRGIRLRPRSAGLFSLGLAGALFVTGCGANGFCPPGLTGVTWSSSSSAGGALSTWTVSGTASQIGESCGGDNLYVDITAPSGTVLPLSSKDYSLLNLTSGLKLPLHVLGPATPTNSVAFEVPDATNWISPFGDAVQLTLDGVQNPAVGTYPGSDLKITLTEDCYDGETDSPATGLTFVHPLAPLSFDGVTTGSSTGTPSQTITAPEGKVGQFFFEVLQATGGDPPYCWALSSGTLPPGLQLACSGALIGTPTQAGTFTLTATVTDLYLKTFDAQVTVVIDP